MKITLKSIGIAALATLAAAGAVVATQGAAFAAKHKTYFCDMKGTWINAAGNKDDFLFLAEYVDKNGPDYFAGKYVNPGQAEADITGRATNGTWEIVFLYTDPSHKNMKKVAVGQKVGDGGKKEITVEGTYSTFLGNNDTGQDGLFRLHGKCRKNR